MNEEEAKEEVKRIGHKIMVCLNGEGILQSLDALTNIHRFIYEDASKDERTLMKKCLAKLQNDFVELDKLEGVKH